MTQAKVRDHADFSVAHMTFVHGMLVTVLIMMMLIGVPKIAKGYSTFEAELPAMTSFVVSVSRFTCAYFPFVLPALLGVMIGDAVLLWHLGRTCRPIWSFLWSAGISCLLALAPLFILFTLVAPFVPIGTSIGTSG